MYGFSFRPESAAARIPEKLAGFDVNPFALAACAKREDESNQFLKGEFSFTGKILGGTLEFGVDILGNKAEKFGEGSIQLA